MVYFTYKYIHGYCPKWLVDVSLRARYRLPEKDSGIAVLYSVSCPISDIIYRKEIKKQNEYDGFFCDGKGDNGDRCPLLNSAKLTLNYPY